MLLILKYFMQNFDYKRVFFLICGILKPQIYCNGKHLIL